METRKLYYEDPMMKEFTAQVVSCEETEKGFAVTLDATAFYPEGGGQACDLGMLNSVNVLDVREKGENIVHLCDAALPIGQTVTGKIDWARRFDLMQQHTGEHIISGILHKHFGCHNVGFHLGVETVTIDFDVLIPADSLPQIEQEANAAIYENLPVKGWFPPEEELAKITYRTKKALQWPVRIVDVPGFDLCACCGVHVPYTGQVGLIKLLSCVKFHEGVRIEMLSGKRAFSYLSRIYEQNKIVSGAFSAKPLETGAAALKMNEALAAEKYRATGLQKQVFDNIAAQFVGKGDVLHFAEGLEPGAVRELSDRIAKVCGGTAAVFSGSDENGYSVCLVNHSAPVADLGKAMNAALSGRGGGKPGFFQGSVKATEESIREFFAKCYELGNLS